MDIIAQTALATAMLNPAVYGDGVEQTEKLETHISHVFFAGPFVYKIKKAVNLGFLDFRTLDARRFYCQEELRLNRRLAPALYLDVIAITGSPEHPVLGGDGPAIEYAVKMRRFSQDDLLSRVLARNGLTPQRLDRLAEQVADFHAAINAATASDAFGTPEAIQRPALENFSQIRAASSNASKLTTLESLEQWTAQQCEALRVVFDDRKRTGFVRECHGDLHLGNIALFKDKIAIFDCLEFSENLRWIDVINEVAFLVMDLHDRKRPDLAWRFLNRYLEITGDYDGLRVLRFYIVYRAMVRAKVHWLRAQQPNVSAEDKTRLLAQYDGYVALARDQTGNAKGALFITHGLSGSGKTTHTQSLLETLGAVRIRSDIERKRLRGLPALAHTDSDVGEGLYAADSTALTYQRLYALTRDIIAAGYPVIVDATFLKRAQRDAFRQLAESSGTPFGILDFVADDTTLRERILERQHRQHDASEANIAVLEHQLITQEPLHVDELPWIVT